MNPLAAKRLRQWMSRSFQAAGYERFDALPIDRLDPNWSERSLWLAAARAAFLEARVQRDRLRYPVTVAVTFALTEGKPELHSGWKSAEELEREFGETPPMLTLLPADPPTLEERDPNEVHPTLFGIDAEPDLGCALEEWVFPEDESTVHRSLLLYSLPG